MLLDNNSKHNFCIFIYRLIQLSDCFINYMLFISTFGIIITRFYHVILILLPMLCCATEKQQLLYNLAKNKLYYFICTIGFQSYYNNYSFTNLLCKNVQEYLKHSDLILRYFHMSQRVFYISQRRKIYLMFIIILRYT